MRHLAMFCVVGFVAAVITLALYAVFRLWWPPLGANLLAVTLSSLFNNEANRRLTFRRRSRSPVLEHLQAVVVFGLYCGFTSGALLTLHALSAGPPRWIEFVVLLASSAIGTLGRFVLLSVWVFPPRPVPAPVVQHREETLT